jgi:hypothetical protein
MACLAMHGIESSSSGSGSCIGYRLGAGGVAALPPCGVCLNGMQQHGHARQRRKRNRCLIYAVSQPRTHSCVRAQPSCLTLPGCYNRSSQFYCPVLQGWCFTARCLALLLLPRLLLLVLQVFQAYEQRLPARAVIEMTRRSAIAPGETLLCHVTRSTQVALAADGTV